MKRIVILTVLFTSFSMVYAQDLSTERKFYYLNQSENKIFTLPFSFDHINDVFMPEIILNRRDIAPHYPNRMNLTRDETAIKNAFHSWIETYPLEYRTYQRYLDVYFSEHNN